MRKISRREFIKDAASYLAGFQAGYLAGGWQLSGQSDQILLPTVAVAAGSNSDSTAKILSAALEGLGGIERFVRPGQSVVIKANATWAFPPFTASSTDPELLEALISLVQAAGASRIIIMDHCSIDPGTAEALRVSGIGAVVKKLDVEGIFPDRDKAPLETYERIALPQGKAFKRIGVIKQAVAADVRINLAVAKSHNVARYSMCLKHMMGFLQSPAGLHTNLWQGIADINTPSQIKADLHILEAIRVRYPVGNYGMCAGSETDLTNPKVVRRMNQVIAGTDPVLIDAYGCKHYYEIEPLELPYMRPAIEAGIGQADVEGAIGAGSLKVLTVGQQATKPAPTATLLPNTETPTEKAFDLTPTTTRQPATATPRPTPTFEPGSELRSPFQGSSGGSGGTVVDPRPFLWGALLPAALAAAGIGLAILRRISHRKEEPKGGSSQA